MCYLRADSHPCNPNCPPNCEVLHPAPSWTSHCSSTSTCPTAREFAQLPRLTQLQTKHAASHRSNAHSLRLLTRNHRTQTRIFNHKILELEARHGASALEIDTHRQEQCVFNADFESGIRAELRIRAALELITEDELARMSGLSAEAFEAEMGSRMADNLFFDRVCGFALGDGGVVEGQSGAMGLGMRRREGGERRLCADGDGRTRGDGGARGILGGGGSGKVALRGGRADDDGSLNRFWEKARELPWEEVRCERDRHFCYLYFSTEALAGGSTEG
ncbi:hypothetical protein MMC18_007230 [Xylographa bjoerkii]|nr:hypothetical protein [Xylographa bjoerkii]